MPEEWQRLVAIVARLRAPDGCPWDRDQTPRTLTPYIIEEAHEVVEAIETADDALLREELGDLLLQVLLQAQIASEGGRFTIEDVCRALADKMLRRHPHVFGSEPFLGMKRHLRRWEELKDAEKAGGPVSSLSGVPPHLPALMRAEKVQQKAARVGFDWSDPADIREKVVEELQEIEEALASGENNSLREEFGDLLFILVNWGRHRGIHAEEALRGAIHRFTHRFQAMEERLHQTGRNWEDLDIQEMERLWQEAKQRAAD